MIVLSLNLVHLLFRSSNAINYVYFFFVFFIICITFVFFFFFFQAEDGIRDLYVTGVQTCALPILTVKVHSSRAVDGCSRTAWLSRSSAPAEYPPWWAGTDGPEEARRDRKSVV